MSTVTDVMKNLSKEIRQVNNRTMAGVTAAGIMIEGEAIRKAPADTGNLRNSRFSISGDPDKLPENIGPAPVSAGTDPKAAAALSRSRIQANNEARSIANRLRGLGPVTVVGFSANYAVEVHEDLNARHTNGEAKYLENAVNQNRGRILNEIKKRAKVGLMATVARDIITILDDAGLGTFAATSGWGIYLGHWPTAPDTVIAVFDTGGAQEPFPDASINYPTVQVVTRGGYTAAYDKLRSVADELIVDGSTRSVSGFDYIGVWQDGDILGLGPDDNNRYRFSANFRILRQTTGA